MVFLCPRFGFWFVVLLNERNPIYPLIREETSIPRSTKLARSSPNHFTYELPIQQLFTRSPESEATDSPIVPVERHLRSWNKESVSETVLLDARGHGCP